MPVAANTDPCAPVAPSWSEKFDPVLERVVEVSFEAGCGVCHATRPPARAVESMVGVAWGSGDRAEAVKTLSYRHVGMIEMAMRCYPGRAPALLERLGMHYEPRFIFGPPDPAQPAADAWRFLMGAFESQLSLPPELVEAVSAWVVAGAPLPREAYLSLLEDLVL
jgi:hypothetical protein